MGTIGVDIWKVNDVRMMQRSGSIQYLGLTVSSTLACNQRGVLRNNHSFMNHASGIAGERP